MPDHGKPAVQDRTKYVKDSGETYPAVILWVSDNTFLNDGLVYWAVSVLAFDDDGSQSLWHNKRYDPRKKQAEQHGGPPY